MAGITLQQAELKLAMYLAAEEAVLTGQEYEIAGRKLKRADIEFIQRGIETWNKRVKDLAVSASGSRRTITIKPSF
jgi:3-deoxy-D-manno-octulosonate 8-phosphate phosphatase KdsC-like HAD superfamily phosphatase